MKITEKTLKKDFDRYIKNHKLMQATFKILDLNKKNKELVMHMLIDSYTTGGIHFLKLIQKEKQNNK